MNTEIIHSTHYSGPSGELPDKPGSYEHALDDSNVYFSQLFIFQLRYTEHSVKGLSDDLTWRREFVAGRSSI
jgi:hypothetical protein